MLVKFPEINLTEFGKKGKNAISSNLTKNSKTRITLPKERKAKEPEGLEGSKTSPVSNIEQKVMKNDKVNNKKNRGKGAGRGMRVLI
ncbi:MAG TPA: hypothetical protein VJU13_04900 [Candidatus Nitrosocosmicus sp.]|nr:hypothetical protein [Candidatus Nitrosocosmicus sp.]